VQLKISTIVLNNCEGLKKTYLSLCNFINDNPRVDDLITSWIIKDGKSTDQTIDFLNELKLNISLTIESSSDKGIYDAMNQSLEFINDDDWVLFLNAGDQLSQEFVNKYSVRHFEGADIVFSDMLYGGNLKMIEAPPTLDFAYLLGKTVNHQSFIIKGKWIRKYKFNTDYTIVADWVQLFEILKNENIIVKKLNYPICVYEGGGISEIQEEKRKTQRMDYLKSVYSEWELEGLFNLSRLRQRNWYDFLLKSLDSPKRDMILKVVSKCVK
jgi:hypothetical protein